MQTLKHRAEHQQFLLMPFCHLSRRHAGVGGVSKHQEQISVERPAHTLAHILNVTEQVLQVEVDLKGGLDP